MVWLIVVTRGPAGQADFKLTAMSDNPWPNLGSQPEAQPKRNNFPKVQNRVGRPNIVKKEQPAKKIEALQQSSIVKTELSSDPDFDITRPAEVIAPNESSYMETISKIQAEILSGEHRLVTCFAIVCGLEY
jgi:hypothetical protein